MKAFEDRFSQGDIFRSASEICGLPLVPKRVSNLSSGQSISPGYPTENPADPSAADATTLQAWWNNFQLTGDNLRESPYGDIYPRLTTKSNTFTVHLWVQSLKKVVTTPATTFTDPTDTSASGPKDVVLSEYRGSYQIERYVDPGISTTPTTPSGVAFPDYASNPGGTPISTFYKFRTLNTKEF